MNKADNDINKMKHLYEVFNKEVQNYDKEKSSSEYKYLKDSLDKKGKRIKVYESEGNNINANNDLYHNTGHSSVNISKTNNCINNNIIILGEPNFLNNNIKSNIKPEQSGTINELGYTEEQV